MNKIEKIFFDNFVNYLNSNPQILLQDFNNGCAIVPFFITVTKVYDNAVDFTLSRTLTEDKLKKHYWTLYYSGDEEYIDGYKPDFTLEYSCYQAAIEIDGHDFHEKTKEQASYDKKKDRCYIKNGYLPFHFTGSDIYHSCEDKCEEILKTIYSFFNIAGSDLIINRAITESRYNDLNEQFDLLNDYTENLIFKCKTIFENTELSWAEKSILLLIATHLKSKISVPYKECASDESGPYCENLALKGYFDKTEDGGFHISSKFYEMLNNNREEDK